MCFVLGLIFGNRANSIAPKLSSNGLHQTFALSSSGMIFLSASSSSKHIMGIASLMPCERDTYSAYVLDSAMVVCSFDLQANMQSAYLMINPVQDFAVVGSISASDCIHNPEKSASAYASKPLSTWFQQQSICLGVPEVLYQVNDCVSVRFLRVTTEASALVYHVCDVRPSAFLQEI